jgi:hypothetical protein
MNHTFTDPIFFGLISLKVAKIFKYLVIVILLIPVIDAISTPDSPPEFSCKARTILRFTSSIV